MGDFFYWSHFIHDILDGCSLILNGNSSHLNPPSLFFPSQGSLDFWWLFGLGLYGKHPNGILLALREFINVVVAGSEGIPFFFN
jgi:hypothetical protein